MYSLAGPPGSGKSTHVKALEADGFVSISAGEVLRQLAPPEILAKMNKGYLIDHVYTNSLMAQGLDKLQTKHRAAEILIDGYPRAVAQARWLLEEYGAKLRACIILDADNQFLIENLRRRRRSDDQKEAIEKRIQIFRKNVEPLIDYYRLKGIDVYRIASHRSIEQVLVDIKGVLSFVQ